MPTPGSIIHNPDTGDSYEFIETSAGTGGERVVMKAVIRRKGQLVPKHFHMLQDETFDVVSGQLTVWLDGKETVHGPGSRVELPKGVAHNHYNASDEPLTYIHTVSPGLDFDHLIENLVGLAADGKSKDGDYGLMQQLVSLRYLDSRSYLADMPVGLQDALSAVVGPLGRLLGYRAIYRKYSGFEK